MSRYRSDSAYSFNCRFGPGGYYEITWVVDFYYKDSRSRFPRRFSRLTDEKGGQAVLQETQSGDAAQAGEEA